jgi:hypothetical protein
MSDATAASAAADPPAADETPAWVDLFLRPEAFFGQGRAWLSQPAQTIGIIGLGIAIVFGRLLSRLGTLPPGGAEPPRAFVLTAIGMGVVSVVVGYFIGKGVFSLRARWSCGRWVASERLAPVFGLSTLATLFAQALDCLLDLSSSPLSYLGWASLPISLWSILLGYWGVSAVAPVVRWKARLWFVVIPLLIITWQIWRGLRGWR